MIAGQREGCSGQRQAYNFGKEGEYSLSQHHPKQAAELRAAAVWSRTWASTINTPLLVIHSLWRIFTLISVALKKCLLVNVTVGNSSEINSECFLYYLRMICRDGENCPCLDWLIFCSVASWRRINLFFLSGCLQSSRNDPNSLWPLLPC